MGATHTTEVQETCPTCSPRPHGKGERAALKIE